MEKHHKDVGSLAHSIDIGLGYYEELSGIFDLGDASMKLEEVITFQLSQTLQRDLHFGSWAQAYKNGNGQYRVRITSPKNEVKEYERLIQNYIAAARLAQSSYYEKVPHWARKTWKFLMPFGMAMANVKSIQLLHFPPLETFTYRDYLYSPTNRRWECLLAQNGFDGSQNTTVERIVDVEPIAAPGGAGEELKAYNDAFVDYAKAQLKNFLRPLIDTDGRHTQPVVAYGGPVHAWLKQAFYTKDPKTEAEKKNNRAFEKLRDDTPRVLDILELSILEDGGAPSTWVLCANHPSQYLYDTDIPIRDAEKPVGEYGSPIDVMTQDLVSAGWQAHMSEHPASDAHAVLREVEKRWGCDAKTKKLDESNKEKVALVESIMTEQDAEFRLDNSTFKPTGAQSRATHFAIRRSHSSGKYAVYAFEPESEHVFSAVPMDPTASFDSSHRLMQVGGYLIDWTPPSPDGNEAAAIHYRIFEFERDSGNPFAERIKGYGYFSKEKFFGKYRSNFGADFSRIELIGLPGYVLSIIPAQGRRTYQLWNFDAYAEGDCLSAGDFEQGGFRDIRADSELYPMGNYVIERNGTHVRVWSFDPQSSPPLALPTTFEGRWPGLGEGDRLATLGDFIVTWDPKAPKKHCKIWQFDPTSRTPLGTEPKKTCPLPPGFDEDTYLFGVLPRAPHDEKKETKPGSIEFMRKQIEHVVYYMLESRSFDNVLGWLYQRGQKDGLVFVGGDRDGFRGLDPQMKNRLPSGQEASVQKYENGKLSAAFVLGGPAQDPWHDNSDALMQMFHGYDGYQKRHVPKMDGFAWNQDSASVMSSFTPEQLTVLNGLAANFAVSDDWFSSVPGGTDVNRGFSVSGSAYNRLGTWEGGKAYADWPDSPHRQSLWKVLWNHGRRDFKIYYNILWQNAVFTYQLYLAGLIPEVDAAWSRAVLSAEPGQLPNSQWIAPYAQFEQDVKYDKLPSFSYIEPAWVGKGCTSYHPGSGEDGPVSLVGGERALNGIYETLRSKEAIWHKTLLVVTFDKNGGLYDHVPPPYTTKPWPHDVSDGFEFDLMGPRVPAVLASPWIRKGTVLRAGEGAAFDATSFAATLLDWYRIPRGTWGLGDRMPRVPTLEKVLNTGEARRDSPTLPNPYDKDFPRQG